MSERLSEKAYRLIRRKIVSLQLAPSEMIDEHALMQELGLGRTPIREALLVLAREGLVTVLPRRGMLVTDVRITDLQKIFELRILLEGYCARLAAQRVTPEQIAQMEAVLRELDQEATMDLDALMDVDGRFHSLLYRAADNEYLAQALASLYALSMRLWYLALDRTSGVQGVVRMHAGDLEALKARDGEMAERIIQKHIAEFQERIRAVL